MRRELLLCVLFILEFLLPVQSLHYQVASLPGITAGDCVGFRALCDQLYNIAFPRLWGSDVPTVPASSIHVAPWTVIAESNPPLGQDALIRATASLCLFTGRASIASSIVREHDFLGAHPNHTESDGDSLCI